MFFTAAALQPKPFYLGDMPHGKLPLSSKDDFIQEWKATGGVQSEKFLDVAWRRYQHVHAEGYQTTPESDHPTLAQLEAFFGPLLNHESIAPLWANVKYVTVPANTIPWLATGVFVHEEQPVSVFAAGRTWTSKLLDLYLPPQFNMWYRIGLNGSIFNSTHDTRTFKCLPGQEGELYLAHQVPGNFQDRVTGRVGSNLSVYENAEGAFQVVIVQWNHGTHIDDINEIFQRMFDCNQSLVADGTLKSADPYGLLTTGLKRLSSDYFMRKFPVGWKMLWFLGVSEIFSQDTDSEETNSSEVLSEFVWSPSEQKEQDLYAETEVLSASLERTTTRITYPMIRCLPDRNVGILQKDLSPATALMPTTYITWSWNISSLPSRLREDTTITHDYLSLAIEFENGRDITYTWSWELPDEYGYWCPIPAWADREYHVVVRSGTSQLGQWLKEKRDLCKDYIHYINDGNEQKAVPKQITRVWLIAGNRWQRYRGEMLIKQIKIMEKGAEDQATVVL